MLDPISMGLGALLGGMGRGGTRVSTSTSSSAINTITFNPVVSAVTGMGNPVSPSISASPSTSASPSDASNASGGSSASPLGGLGLGGLLGTGVTNPYTGLPGVATSALGGTNGVAVATNSQTMMWLILGGGIALMLLMPPHHGGR